MMVKLRVINSERSAGFAIFRHLGPWNEEVGGRGFVTSTSSGPVNHRYLLRKTLKGAGRSAAIGIIKVLKATGYEGGQCDITKQTL